MSATYSTDFDQWTQYTAQLLREQRWQEIDLQHLIEEVEDLSKSERRGISSQLTRLLMHLLKWEFQPTHRSDSWLDSINDARLQIELAIQDSPSLKAYPETQLDKAYTRARNSTAKQTRLPLATFPKQCPYSLDDVLNEDWLPN